MVDLYQAGTANHATNNETAKNMVGPYQTGMVNHATMNETVKITDTIFIWHVSCIYRQRCDVTYITKKVDICTWLLFVMQLKFYLLCTAQMQFVLYSPHEVIQSTKNPKWISNLYYVIGFCVSQVLIMQSMHPAVNVLYNNSSMGLLMVAMRQLCTSLLLLMFEVTMLVAISKNI